jgi:hypothetical protein
MCTDDRFTSRLLVFCLALASGLLAAPTAGAHPVAQGALEIVVFPDRVALRPAVSSEEVIIAATYSGRSGLTPLEMARIHGDYLLAHFWLTADGRPLAGRVVGVPGRVDGRLNYEIEYRLSGGAPERIAVHQDVLREFEFAPGNPWEATYVARAEMSGNPAMEGLLLRSNEPLLLDVKRLASLDATDSGVDRGRLTREYVRHGILHILSGYDHLLFITGLVLAVATLWDLVKVISAFTLAHSITLTLAVLNLVRLPERIVEPMIAASIVFVALQNIVAPSRSRGRGRLFIAFFFGLFHGLGFAGGLLSAMQGMAGFAVGLAVVAFSAGVEIGHQLIVIPVFCALKVMRGAQDPVAAGTRQQVLRYGSAGIFMAGIFYLVAALR